VLAALTDAEFPVTDNNRHCGRPDNGGKKRDAAEATPPNVATVNVQK